MIDQLVEAGQTLREIGESMGIQGGVTDAMLRHYKNGTQPLYWRGDALVKYWCAAMGRTTEELPTRMVPWHFRVPRRPGADMVVKLPQWPVAAPVSVKPIKRLGRPKKVKEAA